MLILLEKPIFNTHDLYSDTSSQVFFFFYVHHKLLFCFRYYFTYVNNKLRPTSLLTPIFRSYSYILLFNTKNQVLIYVLFIRCGAWNQKKNRNTYEIEQKIQSTFCVPDFRMTNDHDMTISFALTAFQVNQIIILG